jgi:hypothetical protein
MLPYQLLFTNKINKLNTLKKNESFLYKNKNNNKMDNNKMDNNKMDNNKMDNNKMDNNKMDNNKMDNNKMDNNKMDNNKMDNNKMNNNKMDNNKMDNNKMKSINTIGYTHPFPAMFIKSSLEKRLAIQSCIEPYERLLRSMKKLDIKK